MCGSDNEQGNNKAPPQSVPRNEPATSRDGRSKLVREEEPQDEELANGSLQAQTNQADAGELVPEEENKLTETLVSKQDSELSFTPENSETTLEKTEGEVSSEQVSKKDDVSEVHILIRIEGDSKAKNDAASEEHEVPSENQDIAVAPNEEKQWLSNEQEKKERKLESSVLHEENKVLPSEGSQKIQRVSPSGNREPCDVSDEVQSSGGHKPSDVLDEVQPSGGHKPSDVSDEMQPSGDYKPSDVSDQVQSSGDHKPSDVSDGVQPSGDHKRSDVSDKVQPSGGRKPNDVSDEVQNYSKSGSKVERVSETASAPENQTTEKEEITSQEIELKSKQGIIQESGKASSQELKKIENQTEDESEGSTLEDSSDEGSGEPEDSEEDCSFLGLLLMTVDYILENSVEDYEMQFFLLDYLDDKLSELGSDWRAFQRIINATDEEMDLLEQFGESERYDSDFDKNLELKLAALETRKPGDSESLETRKPVDSKSLTAGDSVTLVKENSAEGGCDIEASVSTSKKKECTVCKFCCQSFPDPAALRRHFDTFHEFTEIKPWGFGAVIRFLPICPECDRRFDSLYNLNVHMVRRHKQGQQYKQKTHKKTSTGDVAAEKYREEYSLKLRRIFPGINNWGYEQEMERNENRIDDASMYSSGCGEWEDIQETNYRRESDEEWDGGDEDKSDEEFGGTRRYTHRGRGRGRERGRRGRSRPPATYRFVENDLPKRRYTSYRKLDPSEKLLIAETALAQLDSLTNAPRLPVKRRPMENTSLISQKFNSLSNAPRFPMQRPAMESKSLSSQGFVNQTDSADVAQKPKMMRVSFPENIELKNHITKSFQKSIYTSEKDVNAEDVETPDLLKKKSDTTKVLHKPIGPSAHEESTESIVKQSLPKNEEVPQSLVDSSDFCQKPTVSKVLEKQDAPQNSFPSMKQGSLSTAHQNPSSSKKAKDVMDYDDFRRFFKESILQQVSRVPFSSEPKSTGSRPGFIKQAMQTIAAKITLTSKDERKPPKSQVPAAGVNLEGCSKVQKAANPLTVIPKKRGRPPKLKVLPVGENTASLPNEVDVESRAVEKTEIVSVEQAKSPGAIVTKVSPKRGRPPKLKMSPGNECKPNLTSKGGIERKYVSQSENEFVKQPPTSEAKLTEAPKKRGRKPKLKTSLADECKLNAPSGDGIEGEVIRRNYAESVQKSQVSEAEVATAPKKRGRKPKLKSNLVDQKSNLTCEVGIEGLVVGQSEAKSMEKLQFSGEESITPPKKRGRKPKLKPDLADDVNESISNNQVVKTERSAETEPEVNSKTLEVRLQAPEIKSQTPKKRGRKPKSQLSPAEGAVNLTENEFGNKKRSAEMESENTAVVSFKTPEAKFQMPKATLQMPEEKSQTPEGKLTTSSKKRGRKPKLQPRLADGALKLTLSELREEEKSAEMEATPEVALQTLEGKSQTLEEKLLPPKKKGRKPKLKSSAADDEVKLAKNEFEENRSPAQMESEGTQNTVVELSSIPKKRGRKPKLKTSPAPYGDELNVATEEKLEKLERSTGLDVEGDPLIKSTLESPNSNVNPSPKKRGRKRKSELCAANDKLKMARTDASHKDETIESKVCLVDEKLNLAKTMDVGEKQETKPEIQSIEGSAPNLTAAPKKRGRKRKSEAPAEEDLARKETKPISNTVEGKPDVISTT